MKGLENRVALVTGGAVGLGSAIARRLSQDGAQVVITDVSVESGRQSAAECGFCFLEQDVRDEARWAGVIKDVEDRYGRIDILVNNAAIVGRIEGAEPENLSLADWRSVFAVNVEGMVAGCRAVIPAMRRVGVGSIVNIGSVAGLLASPSATAYGASKAAVRHLTKSIAQFCAQEGIRIRCNSVSPGVVRTQLWERFAKEQARRRGLTLDVIVAETRATIPLGEFTLPEDVAAAVSFLASSDARQITGTDLLVDGGMVSCDTYKVSSARAIAGTDTRANPSE